MNILLGIFAVLALVLTVAGIRSWLRRSCSAPILFFLATCFVVGPTMMRLHAYGLMVLVPLVIANSCAMCSGFIRWLTRPKEVAFSFL